MAKMRWSSNVLNEYFGVQLSSLTTADPPELPAVIHVGSLVLNQLFVAKIYDAHQVAALSRFVGRLATAIGQYRSAREHLLLYISALPEHSQLDHHRLAVADFEGCVINAHIAITCLSRLGELVGTPQPVYAANDGSDYDRLRLLNNRIKHFDEDVQEASRGGAPVLIAPIWLTNEGLEGSTSKLSYAELADILLHQAEDAKGLCQSIFEEFRKRAANKPQISVSLTAHDPHE